MNTEQRLAQLRAQIEPLRDEIWELEEQRKREEFAELEGRCFRYMNSTGGDSRFPLYQRIVRYGDEYYRVGAEVVNGHEARVSFEQLWSTSTLGEPISQEEYDAGIESCMDDIRRFLSGLPATSEDN